MESAVRPHNGGRQNSIPVRPHNGGMYSHTVRPRREESQGYGSMVRDYKCHQVESALGRKIE